MVIRKGLIERSSKKLEFDRNEERSLENRGSTKEQLLLKDLKMIAEDYLNIEELKKSFANTILRNIDGLNFHTFKEHKRFYIKEDHIKKFVRASNIKGLNVVSVDGSSVTKKYMNVDFAFLKAIAVKYYFHQNHVASIKHYPDLAGFNNYIVEGNFFSRDENTVDVKTSIDLKCMEIKLLNELINRSTDIDLIIIDGSIVITPINLLFSKDAEISNRYDVLLQEYKKLYANCKENSIILIGSIKDTRTSALSNLLSDAIQLSMPSHSNLSDFIKINYREVLKYFSDIDLFNRLLNKTERSCIFYCKRDIDKIRDTGIKKEIPYYFPLTFYAFYLKTAKFDAPYRIEFFMDETHSIQGASEKADLISSILLPISTLNEQYGLPIPQIEAHKRAVFKPHEVELLLNNLTRMLQFYGVSLLEKRRNRRPF
ncbi:MAG: DNA double-strand break repair nuclease NurA [Candidatus Thorarchaeota archaeon]